MDYKEAYDDICQKLMSAYNTTSFIEVKKAIGQIHPELRESEDERIYSLIYSSIKNERPIASPKNKKLALAYLEKQKENPKSADSIPADCVSDAKCENRWHKVQDSLPDNGRLVLAQDNIGNRLLARYDGEGNWEVSVYDNEDYYCRNTITKWCEIPSEKQKEQKHPNGCFTCDEYKKGYEEGRRNGFTAGYNKAMKEVEQKEQKPALTPKRIFPKFAIGDTVCRPMWSDHTIREIYVDFDESTYICVNEEGVESHIPISEQDEWKKKEQKPDDDPLDDPKFLNGFDTGREVQRIFDEQKSAEWSEEDEKMRLEAIKRIDELEYLGIPCNNVRKVLESLRSRPKSSGNWKPSEWQMSMLLAVINDPNNAGSESCYLTLKSIYEQLKKL